MQVNIKIINGGEIGQELATITSVRSFDLHTLLMYANKGGLMEVSFKYSDYHTIIFVSEKYTLRDLGFWVKNLIPREQEVLIEEYEEFKKKYTYRGNAYEGNSFNWATGRVPLVRCLLGNLRTDREWQAGWHLCREVGNWISLREFLSKNQLK